jgi:hypothetical protein
MLNVARANAAVASPAEPVRRQLNSAVERALETNSQLRQSVGIREPGALGGRMPTSLNTGETLDRLDAAIAGAEPFPTVALADARMLQTRDARRPVGTMLTALVTIVVLALTGGIWWTKSANANFSTGESLDPISTAPASTSKGDSLRLQLDRDFIDPRRNTQAKKGVIRRPFPI